MLITQSVSFEYNRDIQFEFPDLSVRKGADLLILGDSGVGKTTFLHLIAGLLRPKTGSIKIGDTDICQLHGKRLDTFRGEHVGIVFQRPHFIQSLTLEENLKMILYLANKPQDSCHIQEILKGLGLLDKLKRYPRQLSQGEQQRASIAVAVINQPKLLLADEPTSALDDKNCFGVIELLKRQKFKSKSSLVIITHDQRLKSEFAVSVTLPSNHVVPSTI
ncbi:ABC transporter ATP-binding protein [Echinicola soli]|nr:ATP-binding cassette domain-containing protein [Echinicola soli]